MHPDAHKPKVNKQTQEYSLVTTKLSTELVYWTIINNIMTILTLIHSTTDFNYQKNITQIIHGHVASLASNTIFTTKVINFLYYKLYKTLKYEKNFCGITCFSFFLGSFGFRVVLESLESNCRISAWVLKDM